MPSSSTSVFSAPATPLIFSAGSSTPTVPVKATKPVVGIVIREPNSPISLNEQVGLEFQSEHSTCTTNLPPPQPPSQSDLPTSSVQEPAWALTAVYASPVPTEREVFWDYFRQFDAFDNISWTLIGDFNQILNQDEKQGGIRENGRRMQLFRDFLECRNLLDLGGVGCKFTWTNKHSLSGLIKKRLDRVVCNVLWRQRFHEAIVYNLHRLYGDHSPILLKIEGIPTPNRLLRPFRFEMAWQTHEDFPDLLRRTWQVDEELNFNLDLFTSEVKHWNFSTFGNIFKKKRVLIARIQGIQRALEIKSNPFLFNLEKELLDELNQVLFQEELMWYQKSRSQWVQFGDRNTKFFHTTTVVRRRRNRIAALKKDDNSWCTDPEELKELHVYREGNYSADCLANLARNADMGLTVLDLPPAEVLSFLDEDCRGLARPRTLLS
ncbi:hypothetical protein REPUB_Repub20aG0145100 [Reevesia pubescens]